MPGPSCPMPSRPPAIEVVQVESSRCSVPSAESRHVTVSDYHFASLDSLRRLSELAKRHFSTVTKKLAVLKVGTSIKVTRRADRAPAHHVKR